MSIWHFIKMAECETLDSEPLLSQVSGQSGLMLHGNVNRSIGVGQNGAKRS